MSVTFQPKRLYYEGLLDETNENDDNNGDHRLNCPARHELSGVDPAKRLLLSSEGSKMCLAISSGETPTGKATALAWETLYLLEREMVHLRKELKREGAPMFFSHYEDLSTISRGTSMHSKIHQRDLRAVH
uniref:Uncharacterized protein n=1 Tax=Vespula pensylvanica TaxID=30213 RepID=A0A834UEJ7_VESPE|nr:hypothetical protein H0235_002687 [Vespula pensylvanica]